jgi:hypothetical protein
MTIQNFSMKAGNTKTIQATVDIILNGSLVFRVYKNESVILSKQDMTVADNTFTLTLNPVDTQSLSGAYDYDIVFTDGYSNVTTLFEGTFSFENKGIKAQQVFVTAMNLMDEESEDGTYNGYPEEYKKKAWNLLSLLQAELTPATVTPALITDESSVLFLDDRTALTVLPYGLAAHLLMTEDQSRAAFFNARYDELKRKRPAVISKIKDVYAATPSEPISYIHSSSAPVDKDNLDETWE